MKFLIIAIAVVCVQARPDVSHLGHQHQHTSGSDASAPILRSEFTNDPEGGFQYAFETGNGISAQAKGSIHQANANDPAAVIIQGNYKYTSPEGEPIEITYVADENGYQPQGNHLPTPPPVPEAIARSIEFIASHPPNPAGSSKFN